MVGSPYSLLSELKPGLVIHLRDDNDTYVGRQLIDNQTYNVEFSELDDTNFCDAI
jgi:adenylate kinase